MAAWLRIVRTDGSTEIVNMDRARSAEGARRAARRAVKAGKPVAAAYYGKGPVATARRVYP